MSFKEKIDMGIENEEMHNWNKQLLPSYVGKLPEVIMWRDVAFW